MFSSGLCGQSHTHHIHYTEVYIYINKDFTEEENSLACAFCLLNECV